MRNIETEENERAIFAEYMPNDYRLAQYFQNPKIFRLSPLPRINTTNLSN